jgi:hypothetical protein
MEVKIQSIVGCIYLLLGHHAGAVLVATPSPSNPRTSAPANGAPWDNVVQTIGASGVYLGGGWMLTAEHVFDDQIQPFVTYNSKQYLADLNKSYVLGNPLAAQILGLTPKADLVLFRLQEALPGLASISLGTPTANMEITMIGFGSGKSWGTNNIEGPYLQNAYDYPAVTDNDFIGFYTDYDSATQTEGQGTSGDSGGVAFAFIGGQWKIVGIMNAINTTVSPNQTLFSNISTYSSEISNIIATQGTIPETSTALLLLSSALIAFRRRR